MSSVSRNSLHQNNVWSLVLIVRQTIGIPDENSLKMQNFRHTVYNIDKGFIYWHTCASYAANRTMKPRPKVIIMERSKIYIELFPLRWQLPKINQILTRTDSAYNVLGQNKILVILNMKCPFQSQCKPTRKCLNQSFLG